MTDDAVLTGEGVRAWRLAHGLEQAELAEMLDVRPNTISRWELGQRPIAHPRMLALALEALESRLAALVMDDAPPHTGVVDDEPTARLQASDSGSRN